MQKNSNKLRLKLQIPVGTFWEKKYHDLILTQLQEANYDFAGAFRDDKAQANPNIEIFESGTGPFTDDINRTKPRLVIKK